MFAVDPLELLTLDRCGAVGPVAPGCLDADSRGRMGDLIGQFWADPGMSAEDAAAELKAIIQGAM